MVSVHVWCVFTCVFGYMVCAGPIYGSTCRDLKLITVYLFIKSVSLSQTQNLQIGLARLASLIWGSPVSTSSIPGGICDIYMSSRDLNSSPWAHVASTLTTAHLLNSISTFLLYCTKINPLCTATILVSRMMMPTLDSQKLGFKFWPFHLLIWDPGPDT